jgi:hypothetical protein
VPTEFAQLTLALVASHAANTIYDVFGFANSGVATIATGPAWTNITAGTSDRGSGGTFNDSVWRTRTYLPDAEAGKIR